MLADPQNESRVTSGEPPDDADPRRTGPESAPSEELEVTFLDDEDPEVGTTAGVEPDDSRPRE